MINIVTTISESSRFSSGKTKQKKFVVSIDLIRYPIITLSNISHGLGYFVHVFCYYGPLLSSLEYKMKYQRETAIVFVGM